MLSSDTIFALSSGSGAACGVAVIRISGPSALPVAQRLLAPGTSLPPPRRAALRALHAPHDEANKGELLDRALVLVFRAPRSFTGEDVVELHVHGSRAVVRAVSDALAHESVGARPAVRGEFTRRAFEHGRMDLTEVEGLADLLAADTDFQRRQALRQMDGELRAVFERWRTEVRGCLAHAEAVIDFGDDVEDAAFENVLPRVQALCTEMRRKLDDERRGEVVRDGVQIAIVGPPNAGKSSLLNVLARRPAAIVSPIAGTTRDVVEVALDLSGIPVIVRDTAGLRERADDAVELEGMRRAREVASRADITLVVRDASDYNEVILNGLEETRKEWIGVAPRRGATTLVVANKIDLVNGHRILPKEPVAVAAAERGCVHSGAVFETSLTKGYGVDALLQAIEDLARTRLEGGEFEDHSESQYGNETVSSSAVRPEKAALSGQHTEEGCDQPRLNAEPPVITRTRHRYHVERCVIALSSFIDGRTGPNRAFYLPMDLATEELRIASRELGSITGVIHVEEVLDVIFNDFCIGK